MRGGTFTISNHGVGGSLLAAPIVINQPQVAILGIGKVQRRVCVVQAEASNRSAYARCVISLSRSITARSMPFRPTPSSTRVVATLEQWI
jgi:2-oxoglutarate dehydrogenase E2 component (dihydrolipoamide succinyltransferase)